MNATSLAAWLEDFRSRYLPLERAASEASWLANTEITPENERQLEERESACRLFLAQPELYESFVAVDHPPDDALLARERFLAYRLLRANRVNPAILSQVTSVLVEIESEFVRFRADLRGELVPDNRLKEVLRTSTDSELCRDAWLASKQIGPRVADRVRRAMSLRNQQAREAGFDHYHQHVLTLTELDPTDLFDLLERLANATEEPFRQVKAELDEELAARFGIRTEDLQPWHYGDPFFQSAPRASNLDLDRFYAGKDLEALTLRYFDGIGLDIRPVLAKSDLYERAGKCQHAFCTHIGRSGDVRVLCNVRSDDEWMSTMLHEFGHAVYDRYLDFDLPPLLRAPSHTLTTEAIAMLLGRLSRNAEFLVEIAGANPAEARAVAERARAELRRNELIFIRWALVVVHFERELITNPDQDFDSLWWDLVERFQLVRRPEGRSSPDWAAKIHVAVHPVYYQNYILGDLAASQFAAWVDRNIPGEKGLIDNRAFGEWLVERIFRPSNSMRWSDLIPFATGEPLDPEHFVREFA